MGDIVDRALICSPQYYYMGLYYCYVIICQEMSESHKTSIPYPISQEILNFMADSFSSLFVRHYKIL